MTLAPGGHVGEHNHVGPGIRQVTSGHMTYVLPDQTVVYGPGDFFFESGDVAHTVFNKTDAPMVHVLFEILPVDLKGPSLIPVQAPLSCDRRPNPVTRIGRSSGPSGRAASGGLDDPDSRRGQMASRSTPAATA